MSACKCVAVACVWSLCVESRGQPQVSVFGHLLPFIGEKASDWPGILPSQLD